MTVTYSKIEETMTDANLPTNSAVTYNVGINAPSGTVESLIIRGDLTYLAGSPCSADFSNLVSSLRIVINGEVVHDFRAGYANEDNNACGMYGYFLNSIGGRVYEKPDGTTNREFYWSIPLGKVTTGSVTRYEVIINWAATAVALDPASTNKLSMWLKYNDATQDSVTVVPSTSFTHAIAQEQVVVRVPQNIQGVVSAILVQNDSAADELGSSGIRANSLGSYGFEPSMWRWMNGDMANGIQYADSGTSTTQQTFATECAGGLVLPLFGLSGGDIILQVDSSAVTTRTYTPIITQNIGTKNKEQVRQTQSDPTNTAKSILKKVNLNE